MHKKIGAELESLANSILQMENKEDVLALHKKAQAIYEKLTVLKFVELSLETGFEKEEASEIEKIVEEMEQEIAIDEEILENLDLVNKDIEMVQIDEIEDELIDEIEQELEEEIVEIKVETTIIEEETVSHFELDTVQEKIEIVKTEEKSTIKLLFEEEFKDAVSADIATSLFEKVHKENPVIEKIEKTEKVEEVKKKSLNDALFSANIQVGLNDRIAFVKFLFDGSQEDFNRVLSQLNSFKAYDEALTFLNDFVKPDYNWEGKDEIENRLKNLIERKFM